MTRRDWWLGVSIVLLVVLATTAFPRYEWQQADRTLWLKIDRWTGRAEPVRFLTFVDRLIG